jgi:DNA-binding MarR family transcriptional regulator
MLTVQDPLTRQQIKILEALTLTDFDEGATAKEIAEQTAIPEPSVRITASRLDRLGYIMHRRNDNTRAHVYSLTETGRSRLDDRIDQTDRESDQSSFTSSPSKVIGMIKPPEQRVQSFAKRKLQDQSDHIDHSDQIDHMLFDNRPDYYEAGL